MVERREAVIEVLMNAFFAVGLHRLLGAEESAEQPRWSSPWVVVGLLSAAVTTWLSDTDYRGLGMDRRRHILFSVGRKALSEVAFRERDQRKYEFLLGNNVGTVLYRLRYGVLGGPPGEE